MKNIFVLFCLGATIALSAGQYTLSPTFIKYRNQIVSTNYASYQKIDSSFFKLYNALRSTTDLINRPFLGIYNDLNNAYKNLNVDSLLPDIAGNFTAFINDVNTTLWFQKEFSNKIALSTFSMMMMGPDFLTPPANSFKSALMPLSSLMMRVNTPMVTEECLELTMSEVVSIYKPYVQELVDLADVAIKEIPVIFANATTISQSSFIELRSLISKINSCAKSSSKNNCIDQLNQQNTNCNEPNSCLAQKAVIKPQLEINFAVMAIQRIYPMHMMPNMGINDKFQQLNKICLDPPTSS